MGFCGKLRSPGTNPANSQYSYTPLFPLEVTTETRLQEQKTTMLRLSAIILLFRHRMYGNQTWKKNAEWLGTLQLFLFPQVPDNDD